MFALEDGPFVAFSPFFALFPDAHVSLNSARSGLAVSSFPGAESSPTVKRLPTGCAFHGQQSHPGRSSQSYTGINRSRMSTHTNVARNPIEMSTYESLDLNPLWNQHLPKWWGGGLTVIRVAKIRRRAKSCRMIFLQKESNNHHGMISLQKKGEGGWGCRRVLL
jgi:hypothetical protein